jgi:hypothetical protein
MGLRLAAVGAAASAAVALATVGTAAPAGAKQRVAITSKTGVNTFVLTPLQRGAVRRDAGTVTWGSPSERTIVRGGQTVEIDNILATLAGKNGSLQLQFRIEWLNAGNKYFIGVGKWTVVRGTGAYERVSGAGHNASSWLPRGPVTFRAEGFLRL